jgi:hypothetical protein
MKNQTEQQTKTVFKVIFAWQDEMEEKWLEKMAAEGWHLQRVFPWFYTFQKGAPQTVIYRMDYKNTLDKDYKEYSEIFRDSGWELVSIMASWHYYRIKPENNSTPEIFNSARAKVQKYRRLLVGLTPILIVFGIIFNPALHFYNHDQNGKMADTIGVAGILQLVVLALLIYAVIRIWLKIRKLESQSKE